MLSLFLRTYIAAFALTYLNKRKSVMKLLGFSLYTLTLALWVGGVTLFTFIATPVIFRSFGRDLAGEIVGKLFPGYFLYNFILVVLALALIFLFGCDRTMPAFRLSFLVLVAAIVVNGYIVFKLHPQMQQVKQEIASFEREPADSAARKKFRSLHGISAVLNLLHLAGGVTLLVVSPLLKK